jgi:chemotaxis protein CheX
MSALKINPIHPFLNRDILLALTEGILNTLGSMSKVSVKFEKPFADNAWVTPKQISVLVKLDSDSYTGQLVFHFDAVVAQKVIESMTGELLAADSLELIDGMGEISNIFYGAAKTKLKEKGLSLAMAIPKPCWSTDLVVKPNVTTKIIMPFHVENIECFFEIAVY